MKGLFSLCSKRGGEGAREEEEDGFVGASSSSRARGSRVQSPETEWGMLERMDSRDVRVMRQVTEIRTSQSLLLDYLYGSGCNLQR